MRLRLAEAGLDGQVDVDSAGLGDWHVGDPPDPRALHCARRRGYDLSRLRARRLRQADFDDFALVVGMDRGHVRELNARRPDAAPGAVHLFLDFLAPEDPHRGRDVPDPYSGPLADYELSLDLIEHGVPHLIAAVRRDLP